MKNAPVAIVMVMGNFGSRDNIPAILAISVRSVAGETFMYAARPSRASPR
jgi:hypothetical protein